MFNKNFKNKKHKSFKKFRKNKRKGKFINLQQREGF